MTPDCKRILDALERHATFADLTDGEAGKHLCKIATDGVAATLASQADPSGQGWPELSDKYAEWKAKNFGNSPMGVLHGLMTDPSEVGGTVVVEPGSAAVRYGVSPEAQDEAAWFQEGSGNRPERPFWGFTDDSLAAVNAYLAQRLKDKVGG